MKNIALILIILILSWSCSHKASETEQKNTTWNLQKRVKHLEHRGDSTTWDDDMLNNDKGFIGIGDIGPFEIGVFPVPKYNLIGEGSFKGIGNQSEDFQIKDKLIVMNSFFVSENELNASRLKGMKNQVFFHILVLTDTIDNENYNLNRSIAISRNHPDYLGQGFVKTKNNRIDYVAFQTAENKAYAIINARLFDLNFGKTILIAPQSDGTLRSLQIESPVLNSDSLLDYTKTLTTTSNVMKFFEDDKTL